MSEHTPVTTTDTDLDAVMAAVDERDERIAILGDQLDAGIRDWEIARERIARLEAALREDAQHIHIIDHHRTKQRIDFEDCPSVFCSERRALLAETELEVRE